MLTHKADFDGGLAIWHLTLGQKMTLSRHCIYGLSVGVRLRIRLRPGVREYRLLCLFNISGPKKPTVNINNSTSLSVLKSNVPLFICKANNSHILINKTF